MFRIFSAVSLVVIWALACQFFVLDAFAAETKEPVVDIAPVSGQQMIIKTRFVEINRSKLKHLGVDYSSIDNKGKIKHVELNADDERNVIRYQDNGTGSSVNFIDQGDAAISSLPYYGFLDALCENKIARTLAEQTIAVRDGCSASLSSGSTVEVQVADKGSEKKFIGTKLEVTPQIVEEDKVRVDFILRCTELAERLSANSPGNTPLRCREIDTTLELSLGETIVLAGSLEKIRSGKEFDEIESILILTPYLIGEEPTGKQTVVHLSQAKRTRKTRGTKKTIR